MRRLRAAAGAMLLCAAAACSTSATGAGGAGGAASSSATRSGRTGAVSSPTAAASDQGSESGSAPASVRPSTRAPASSANHTPSTRRGAAVLAHTRVVAYYGVPGNPTLGALGAGTPEQAAARIEARAAGFRGYGKTVQPAMELIATVAQGAPGPDHTYSKFVPAERIQSYLDVVHAHRMLLILDLQPGRASFLAQAQALRPFLLDPSVHLALDPEWKVTSHQTPGGGRIGASSAAGINEVGAWLSDLVSDHHLPPKLLLVHQFTSSMLPDRSNITQHDGVEMVLHADGFGAVASKISVLHKLAFPDPPFAVGFKLFLRQDARLMTPGEVMALHPRPDVITYQ